MPLQVKPKLVLPNRVMEADFLGRELMELRVFLNSSLMMSLRS